MKRIALAALLVTLGCASAGKGNPSSEPVPDAGYLRERVDRLYAAEVANDWVSWSALVAPGLKTEAWKKEFQEGSRGRRAFKILEYRVRAIRAVPVPAEPSGADAAAAVAMDVMVQEDTGQLHKEEDQTDYWALVKGEWYWIWRGWPDD